MNSIPLLARQRCPTYICADLVAEAWKNETGQDIRHLLGVGERTGICSLGHHMLRRVSRPVSPCVVLLRRAKVEVHVGIFVRGRVLHLSETGPVRQLLSVASIGYTSVRFYASRPSCN
jgi:hypothetical protein